MSQPSLIDIERWYNDGEVYTGPYVKFVSHKIVCPRCKGKGAHMNPAIGAITMDEWYNEWDDDSREMYMTGGYDVVCTECKGQNVVDEVDEEATDPGLVEYYVSTLQDYYDTEAMYRAERAMGC